MLVEPLIATGDSIRYEPGLRRGFRRSNVFTAVNMPVYDRFEPTLRRSLPYAWLVPADDTAAVARLRMHGIEMKLIEGSGGQNHRVEVAMFTVDSVTRAPRAFQGHNEISVTGSWGTMTMPVRGRQWLVRPSADQALLAAILLDPESDDGLTTWNFFDSKIRVGTMHPVVRIIAPLPRALR